VSAGGLRSCKVNEKSSQLIWILPKINTRAEMGRKLLGLFAQDLVIEPQLWDKPMGEKLFVDYFRVSEILDSTNDTLGGLARHLRGRTASKIRVELTLSKRAFQVFVH
jgi:hypothetical protein